MPLLWLACAFISGILMGAALGWPAWIWLSAVGLGAALLLGGWLLRARARGLLYRRARFTRRLPRWMRLLNTVWRRTLRRRVPIPLALLLVSLCLGAARYRLSLPDWSAPDFLPNFHRADQEYVVEGIVSAPPQVTDRNTRLRLKTDRLHPLEEVLFTPVHGELLVVAPPGGDWRYGDRLRVSGVLENPSENEEFSYRLYLARRGIFSQMRTSEVLVLLHAQGDPLLAAIYALRERALGIIRRLYPDPEAALLAGILLGIESGIPEDVQEAFRATGTSHIIAISG